MGKIYTNQNVYDASQSRLEYIFNEFENVLVAFSGGKDSSVCLNMVYEYAKAHGMLDKVAMYHLDYEAQYQMTTDYVTKVFSEYPGIKKYWLCLPIAAQCCCNMTSGTWIPWEREKQNIWVREMPDSEYVINQDNVQFQFKEGDMDYKVQTNFSKWFSKEYGKTAVVVGIRASESLHRYVAVSKDDKKIIYDGKKWCSVIDKNTVNAYPIYDWETSDIWTANAKFEWDYNKLYDLYYQAGLTIDKMRVASPFNDCASETLKLYKVIDPNMWGKMVSRVNGVNFTGIYGGTTAMGWKSITLPKGHTWKSYCEFLLNTLDEDTRNHYIRIFNTSFKYWMEKGGNIDKDLYDEMLQKNNVKIKDVCQAKRYPNKNKVTFEEYPDDIDVGRFSEVPTYKRMCICILKNDYFCKYMGFGQTKSDLEKRKRAIEKYKNI